MLLMSQLGNTQDDNKKVGMVNMMKYLKKTIAKEMSERGLSVEGENIYAIQMLPEDMSTPY